MNIVLIGFRCAGKTTIGRLLSKKLNLEFCDVDEYIENKFNVKIKNIFGSKGESAFRLIEADCICEISKKDGFVIATGGGAVLRYKNMRNLKRNGKIFLLKAQKDTIYKRLKGHERDTRPALSSKPPKTEIAEQMELRKEYYENNADVIVATDDKSPEIIVSEIISNL